MESISPLRQLCHEQKNLLSLILASIQLIERSHPEVQTFPHWQEIQADLHQMNELLLRTGLLEGPVRPQFREVLVSDFFASLYRNCLPWFEQSQKHLYYSTDISPASTFRTDPVLLKQALINLIRNAWEALEENGTVWLRLSGQMNELLFSIKDNGNGMEPEILHEISRPFFSTKASGTGLGFPYARRICDALHVSLSLQSVPSLGTTVTLSIKYHSA
ncbi:MAG: sensor histidine kinase [Lachnospiraceae bacterium]|nr:sensor histidine kinase [Lachnospiraceae bacterium]